jgi:hypothetical protein
VKNPLSRLTPSQRETLVNVGIGVVAGASVLGGVLLLIRRQIQRGDLITIRLKHQLDPETQAIANRYYPIAKQAAERGVDVNMRLFRRREDEGELDLLGALAPADAGIPVMGYGDATRPFGLQ